MLRSSDLLLPPDKDKTATTMTTIQIKAKKEIPAMIPAPAAVEKRASSPKVDEMVGPRDWLVDESDDIVVETVGDTVGDETVGDTVGETVGDTVGDETVGDTVGDTVGETVGDTVGDTVGEIVGDTVGENVGELFGETVGDAVGKAVGNTVGAEAVGDTVGADVQSAQAGIAQTVQPTSRLWGYAFSSIDPPFSYTDPPSVSVVYQTPPSLLALLDRSCVARCGSTHTNVDLCIL